MVRINGLSGLRPAVEQVADVLTPPYDVIKPGSPLEARLRARRDSLFHVILGDEPRAALDALVARGALIPDEEPAYYVIEQRVDGEERTGVYVAPEVTPYDARQIVRHEKTFDEKVSGRIALTRATEHTIGPVFLLTRGPLAAALEAAKSRSPLYEFTHDFGGGTDLHGVATRVFRVAATEPEGEAIAAAIAPHPLYIADGHHRYHAALKNGQSRFLAYVTQEARILAYDRVLNGVRPFADAKADLALRPTEAFATPAKHEFCLYTREGSFLLSAEDVPSDVVGRLDCSILEREVYPALGLAHEHVVDPKFFDYYPENALDEMRAAVDSGAYEVAIALAPVSLDELMAVADAGLDHPEVVMPEKSTFFSPKIPTGVILFRH